MNQSYGSRRRRRLALLVAFAFVLTPVLAGCAAAAAPKAIESNQLNKVGLTQYSIKSRASAPVLSGATLTGTPFVLSSANGDVVVINVWASWCGPCRAESPDLARTSAQFAGQPVRFVGIDEQDGNQQARAFVASTGATYPNLVDSDGALLSRIRVLPQAAVPSTLLLDRHGRIAARVIGPVTGSEVETLVTALLKES